MMTQVEKTDEIPFWRKMVLPLIGGAVAGVVSAISVLTVMDSSWIDGARPSDMIAAVTGGLYCMMAIGVGVGAWSPALGSKYLNVDDIEEVREQRTMLINSSLAMATWGISLFLITLAEPVGPVPRFMALAISGVLLLAGIVFGWRAYRVSDELQVQVNTEATAISYYLIFAVVGGWAMLAHLAYLPMFAPLDLLTAFYWVALLASFIAAGRRGMIKVS